MCGGYRGTPSPSRDSISYRRSRLQRPRAVVISAWSKVQLMRTQVSLCAIALHGCIFRSIDTCHYAGS